MSQKTTVKGVVPLSDDGAATALPVNAALGAVPMTAFPIAAVIPDFTGNLDAADTWTLPPTILEITGVMTPNVQLTPTVATSPISGLPFPSASVKVGAGAVCTPPTTGRLQFVAAASPRISF